MKKYILGIIAVVIALLGINQFNSTGVGSDAVTPIAGQTYTLAGSGVSSSDTSITLTSFTITQTGYEIQDSDMSDVFYLTLEPGSRSRQEIVSCTTVTQNAGDTATLSGCERGLQPFSPYASSTDYAFAHSGGSTLIFSNPPQLYNQAAFKDNDETITGAWLFPTPLSSDSAATKAYVDSVVTGTTTLSNDRLVVAGTAGETLATGTLVYLNGPDQEWYRVNVSSTSTFQDRFIGLTQGSGVNAGAINRGILLKGRDVTQTGMTAGATYYASTSAGTISVATSAQPIGVADDTNVLYFDPVLIDVVREGYNNIFTGSNTFTGTTTFTGPIFGTASATVRIYTATTTWTKPANLRYAVVEVIGGGGAGGGGINAVSASGQGGGGGAYAKVFIPASQLPSTVVAIAGAGGTGVSGAAGNTGATSVFTGFATSTGGQGGTFCGGACGGRLGGTATTSSSVLGIVKSGGLGGAVWALGISGNGGDSFYGTGPLGIDSQGNGTNATSTDYGAGGSGGRDTSNNNRTGGNGATGAVIVTEYY